ncbi:MAG: TIGR02449 family protein [Pseudomonadota bacterium]
MEASPTVAQISNLEQQLDELLVLTQVLSKENKALRAQQKSWSSERAKLIEKNELAKHRVEAMITRLKALEKD